MLSFRSLNSPPISITAAPLIRSSKSDLHHAHQWRTTRFHWKLSSQILQGLWALASPALTIVRVSFLTAALKLFGSGHDLDADGHLLTSFCPGPRWLESSRHWHNSRKHPQGWMGPRTHSDFIPLMRFQPQAKPVVRLTIQNRGCNCNDRNFLCWIFSCKCTNIKDSSLFHSHCRAISLRRKGILPSLSDLRVLSLTGVV